MSSRCPHNVFTLSLQSLCDVFILSLQYCYNVLKMSVQCRYNVVTMSRHTRNRKAHWHSQRHIGTRHGTVDTCKSNWHLQSHIGPRKRHIGACKATLAIAMAHRHLQKHIGTRKRTFVPRNGTGTPAKDAFFPSQLCMSMMQPPSVIVQAMQRTPRAPNPCKCYFFVFLSQFFLL